MAKSKQPVKFEKTTEYVHQHTLIEFKMTIDINVNLEKNITEEYEEVIEPELPQLPDTSQ